MQYLDKQQREFKAAKQHRRETKRSEAQSSLRLGSLCTGYAGLDIAAQKVLGARLAWVADSNRHISKLLATRFPGVSNLGDISCIDWRQVEPVDIVCAGFPCQDISFAGRGAGIAHCVGDT